MCLVQQIKSRFGERHSNNKRNFYIAQIANTKDDRVIKIHIGVTENKQTF